MNALCSFKKQINIENFEEQADMLEWAGVGFGEMTSCLINKALNRLASVTGANNMKFFGKVTGIENDYWVAQGQLSDAEENPANRSQEERGKGCNATVFWVCDHLSKDWIQLPECTPEHICAAKMFVK